jgi:hypothetical protein
VKKIFFLGLALVLVVALVGSANTPVTPREGTPGVLLFDNETGTDVTALVVILDGEIALDATSIFVIGGGGPVSVWVVTIPDGPSYTYVRVGKIRLCHRPTPPPSILAGGTVHIPLPVDYVQVMTAYWE